MGKFAIECPKCGSVNTASTGLFAKKKIPCGTCGNEIDAKAGRITSKICPNCQKVFVYDQAKTKDRKCPSCGEPIDASRAATASYRYTTLNCPQCACAIELDKNCEIGECPICGVQIDIQSEIQKQNLVKDTGISVIQYEGDNQTFIWKHPIEDFNFGSQLIVHASQEAIFFMNGQALDLFGPGRHELHTENIPMVKKFFSGPVGTQTPFHAEVYFINKTVQNVSWGTRQRIQYDDPEMETSITLGACGEFKLSVTDGRKLLLKVLGTGGELGREAWDEDGSAKSMHYESIEEFFNSDIQHCLRTYIPKILMAKGISIFSINPHLDEISEVLTAELDRAFADYGLSVSRCNVSSISVPQDDPSYQKWMALRGTGAFASRAKREEAKGILGDVEVEKARAEVERMKRERLEAERDNADIAASRDAAAAREQIRLKAMEGMADAQVMQAKGYTGKDVLDSEVQKAYAEGMGQWGANAGSSGGGTGMGSEMVNMMMGAKMANMMMDRFEGIQNGNVGAAPAAAANANTWDCACGAKVTGKFCSNCGAQKPAAPDAWDCTCGAKGITGKFCTNCGAQKPATWDCACGTKGITGKFCTNCGAQKPEAWDCACGTKGITGKFCTNCGAQKPAAPEAWDCACGAKGITGKFCTECGAPKPTA